MERTIKYTTPNGQDRIWIIRAEDIDGKTAAIMTTHGAAGGAMQTQTRVVKGKNVGRANATTALEQAWREAEAKYKLKLEKVNPERTTPMLAHEYAGKHIVFPCFVQPKLDGVRGIYDPVNHKIYSRLGNDFPHLDHILDQLRGVNIPLDGELYSTEMPFEELVGLVKKKTYDEKISRVKFHVFDCISESASFEARLGKLRTLHWGEHTVLVDTRGCASDDYIVPLLDAYTARGYEGIMLRNKNGLYVSKRSNDLQKVKKFVDDEFRIVGFKRENNSAALDWICATPSGHEFAARPKGAMEHRSPSDAEAKSKIGKMLTVKYQALSSHGVPRFPVAMRIREDF